MNQVKFSVSMAGVDPVTLLGTADENLERLRRAFDASISARGDRIRVAAAATDARALKEVIGQLIRQARKGIRITPELVEQEVSAVRKTGDQNQAERAGDEFTAPLDSVGVTSGSGRQRPLVPDEAGLVIATPRLAVRPRTQHQIEYVRAIDASEITIAIGPAGTGKTYLAVAKAVSALTTGRVARIVLTRPAVEAGESLGFLPGSFKEKVDPYLRPLYDALYDMIHGERIKRLVDEQVVEVAPLAYMRGRTLSDSFVILDEAQNTTSAQMKMFLTRLGWNSKAIVTGDVTQIDLDHRHSSGLIEIQHRLRGIRGIRFCYLDRSDVVRPPIVGEIIRAYERGQGREAETPSV